MSAGKKLFLFSKTFEFTIRDLPVNKELACEFCTFLNVPNAKICDACGRTLGVPSVNLTSNGIECSQCTYQNPIGTATCHMCGGPIVANKKEDLSTTMMMVNLL